MGFCCSIDVIFIMWCKYTISFGKKCFLSKKTAKEAKVWKKREKYPSLTFGRRYFRSKLKLNANLFGSLLAYSYHCTQNNGRVPFIGIGVSPIGRVVRFVAALFLCLLRGIYLKYVSCSYIMQRYEDFWKTPNVQGKN